MEIKTKVIVVSVIALGSFAAGRWAAPTKIVTKTVEVEKKTESKDEKQDTKKHRDRVTTIVVDPDGKRTTVISDKVDTDTRSHNSDNVSVITKKDSETTKEYSQSKVTISALGGFKIGDYAPIYGASLTKPVLGPITLGAFGLSNGTVGFSLGLTF